MYVYIYIYMYIFYTYLYISQMGHNWRIENIMEYVIQ